MNSNQYKFHSTSLYDMINPTHLPLERQTGFPIQQLNTYKDKQLHGFNYTIVATERRGDI